MNHNGNLEGLANKRQHKYSVEITGDLNINWILARDLLAKDNGNCPATRSSSFSCTIPGEIYILSELIQNFLVESGLNTDTDFLIRPSKMLISSDEFADFKHNYFYSTWSKYTEGKESVWRLVEHLGMERKKDIDQGIKSKSKPMIDDINANLILINDDNLGFRENRELWPQALYQHDNKPWIIMKMSNPIASGMLWDYLLQEHADRLIVVIMAKDLRLSEVQVSEGISWERTAQDVVWELTHNPTVNGLSRCFASVVLFNTDGAVLLLKSPSGQKNVYSGSAKPFLFFDPLHIEGEWAEKHEGIVTGATECILGALAYECYQADLIPDVNRGVQSGLAAMRKLHLCGFEKLTTNTSKKLKFPVDAVVKEIKEPTIFYSFVDIVDPAKKLITAEEPNKPDPNEDWWTILHERYRGNLEHVARDIVREGAEFALKDVPQCVFGHMLRVDRREIEHFRSIHGKFKEYLKHANEKKPLSVAVFGAPGSGKSFGITQIAKSLAPGSIEVLEFNLSQLSAPAELSSAFHQVRDVNLSGKFPLVFWDEFDTSLNNERFGWLRYFLSPMQDGSFRESQITHPIGRAIFVFAGGTSFTMEGFGVDLDPEYYRSVKMPDFISRLKGYVNIPSVNRQPGKGDSGSSSDPYFIIRRAVLLRSILERNAPFLLDNTGYKRILKIDEGVLRAFLEIDSYKHGVRSMEAIIAMSRITGKYFYSRSSLPSSLQLNLHVKGSKFLSLVQQIELDGVILEKLAEANHEHFCRDLKNKGYSYGAINDDEKKTHSSLIPYRDLPEHEKEQNRGAVRDIPTKLSMVGYTMVPARSAEPPFSFPNNAHELELLAEKEHERWMQKKIEDGWEYAESTDKSRKKSDLLIPWSNLPEKEKEKDINFVKAIPDILAQAGYTIIKTGIENE